MILTFYFIILKRVNKYGIFVTFKTFDKFFLNNFSNSQNNIVYLKELIFISMRIYLRLYFKYVISELNSYSAHQVTIKFKVSLTSFENQENVYIAELMLVFIQLYDC